MTDRELFITIIDNDTLKKADVIVVLEGDGFCRLDKAAELYKRKWANKIIFSGGVYKPECGSFPAEYSIPKLIEKGVNCDDIINERKSLHTRQQAEEVMQICLEKKWNKIILVASHYHQYRAFLTFLKVIQEKNIDTVLMNAPARDIPWFYKNDWGIRIELLKNEFNKIEQYEGLGHIATFDEAIRYQKWKEQQK